MVCNGGLFLILLELALASDAIRLFTHTNDGPSETAASAVG